MDDLLTRATRVLAQLEAWLPPAPPPITWEAHAYRWRKRGASHGWLDAIANVSLINPEDLQHIERDLADIVDLVAARPEKFVVFCDDLSFEEGESGYKALKSVLDGSAASSGNNVLIYATSNRRHLMPEYMSENLAARHQADGEVHPGETVEEKISLSERFGLWLSFYPFKQDDYLDIVAHWLETLGCSKQSIAEARTEALQWALERGSRSGRVAWHFARDWAARHA